MWVRRCGNASSISLVRASVHFRNLALGVTALFSVILSVRGLWSLQRGESRQSDNPT